MGDWGLIIGAGVTFVVLLLCFTMWLLSRYQKAGPNEAIVVYGRGRTKCVVGGAVFVWPYINSMKRMNLEIMTIDVNVEEVYTDQGVPCSVDGVAQVKIGSLRWRRHFTSINGVAPPGRP